MCFGQTFTPMYTLLRFGWKVLIHILRWDPNSIVTIPTNDGVYFYQEEIGVKYPNITEAWITTDGFKLPMQELGVDSIQNQLYNG